MPVSHLAPKDYRVVLVRCEFLPGVWPAERRFVVPGYPPSSAPESYCREPDRLAGLMIGRDAGAGTLRVQLPDGDLYEVDAGDVAEPD